MDCIPLEIIHQISGFLSVKDYVAFRSVSRRLFDDGTGYHYKRQVLDHATRFLSSKPYDPESPSEKKRIEYIHGLLPLFEFGSLAWLKDVIYGAATS